ncbi:MAG: sugar ABC transporter permease, partial [Propionibacteriaceae bacterium]|nr:sugar ABC transporter permease [Propionibacteriaceae bacterium]
MFKKWQGLLMVVPSILLVLVFVYGLIGQNIATSFGRVSSKTFAGNERVVAPGGIENYTALLADDRYQASLWNLLVLTLVFVGGTMLFGLIWAILLEKGVTGEGFFRSTYLFPMAVS